MLRRIAGHLAPQRETSAPSAEPCGATSAILGAIGGAAVALAATQLRARNGASAAAEPEAAEPEDKESKPASVPHQVSTVEELRKLLPLRTGGSGIDDAPKVLDHLDDQMLGFIERSPFLQLGTADEDGLPFVSPKGDHPGFVYVRDPRTLIIPDRPGNSILMSLQNLLANPKAGLCFEIPGNPTTLRVGGKVALSNDPQILAQMPARGLDAMLAIVLQIDYAFFHCAKAYMRSRLWEPDSWPEEMYPVGFGIYFAETAEEAAEMDAGTKATYGMVAAAVDGNGVEISTRADAQRTDA